MGNMNPNLNPGNEHAGTAHMGRGLVNMPVLLERVGHDREFLGELFTIFEVEFPRLLVALRKAVAVKDLGQAANLAHRLRGMLTNLSIDKGATAAAALETMATLEDPLGTESALAAFDAVVDGLLPELAAGMASSDHKGRG
jgi:HPt (histidine-containing phosphotransfer) domain-containing protein